MQADPGIAWNTAVRTTTAADLAATDEAPQTTEITELATQLENNPVKIYEYIKNNFKYHSDSHLIDMAAKCGVFLI